MPTKLSGPRPVLGVAGLIYDNDGRVLLAKRSRAPRAGYWHMPGGAVEFGETVADALVRELREELGVETVVVSERPVDMTQSIIPAEDRHIVMLFYDVLILDGGIPRPLDGTEEVGFFSQEDAMRLTPLLDSCAAVLNRLLGWQLPRT